VVGTTSSEGFLLLQQETSPVKGRGTLWKIPRPLAVTGDKFQE